MKYQESADFNPNYPPIVKEYQENLSQALDNIKSAIHLLEQSEQELDKNIALAHEIIDHTIAQFIKLSTWT
ncbi:hypothetical protein [Gloeothece verrucosa]|uniref:Uncharacterized protein n=1 Tax=Gloeothece verrucosa (strain PCC 7822) TaxID=497965 RepID=E0UKC4_GLOV7|nr:hypothetical protein [Gloeothece verrucosa]ADN17005.1 hypothetical protein Cyan7822_5121 [Gloeothece verrucosa PCC 7822]